MAKQDDERKATENREPYEKPTASKVAPEEARLRLLGLATMGEQGAIDLLEMIFAKAPQKEPTPKKNVA